MGWNKRWWSRRWFCASLTTIKLMQWMVALTVFIITCSSFLLFRRWTAQVNINVYPNAKLKMASTCPASLWNVSSQYEVDANTPAVLNPDSNFKVVRLSQWDHAEGSAFYTQMTDVYISGNSLKAFNCRMIYFGGGCALWPDPYPIEELRSLSPEKAFEIDRAIVISQHFGYAYYHWLIEALPRLVMMYDYVQADPSMKIIMFATEVADVAPTVLGLIDVDPDRVVWYTPQQFYFIRDVVIPSPAQCGKPISTALKALKRLLRAKLVEKYPDQFIDHAKEVIPFTIVVQHRGDSQRSLTNHKELVRAVTDVNRDARIIEFGPRESFLSMAQKHFYADIVIGPHGAGLSNVLLAPDGAAIVEIHPNQGNQYDEGPHFVNSCHQRTARRTGLRSVLLLENNGDTANAFAANISRVVDTVRKIRANDFEHIDQYISWQL